MTSPTYPDPNIEIRILTSLWFFSDYPDYTEDLGRFVTQFSEFKCTQEPDPQLGRPTASKLGIERQPWVYNAGT